MEDCCATEPLRRQVRTAHQETAIQYYAELGANTTSNIVVVIQLQCSTSQEHTFTGTKWAILMIISAPVRSN